ncbi:MAG TPA: hypothetical protein VFZ11_11720 [Gemmatimonadaceae bacterium]
MELAEIPERCSATPEFLEAIERYAAGRDDERIAVSRWVPRVKVLRVLAQLFDARPDLAVARVAVEAASGCSDFVGTLHVTTESSEHRFTFAWDCRWRAEQEGWTDPFGFPDQIRAAREFGWRCFARWEEA